MTSTRLCRPAHERDRGQRLGCLLVTSSMPGSTRDPEAFNGATLDFLLPPRIVGPNRVAKGDEGTQRSTDRSMHVSAAARREADVDVVAVAADDRGDDASVVRVAHERGLACAAPGGVALFDACSLGR